MLKDTCQVSARDLSDIGEDLKVYPGVVHDTQESVLTGGRILQEVEVEASYDRICIGEIQGVHRGFQS